MSDLMDKIGAHHSAKERKKHHVEEWDTTLYTDPISIKRFDKIDKIRKTYPLAEGLARTLILIAEDSEGKKAFGPEDRMMLIRKGDLSIIAKAVTALTADAEVSVDELEKD